MVARCSLRQQGIVPPKKFVESPASRRAGVSPCSGQSSDWLCDPALAFYVNRACSHSAINPGTSIGIPSIFPGAMPVVGNRAITSNT